MLTTEFYQTFKEEIMSILHNLFKKLQYVDFLNHFEACVLTAKPKVIQEKKPTDQYPS